MNPYLLSLVVQFANLHGYDPALIAGMIEVESKWNVNAIGSKSEIGLMQIMPSNYKGVSKKQLLDPATNIILGIKLLDQYRQTCKHHKDDTYLLCYNLGMNKASKIRHPKQFIYYTKVIKARNKILKDKRYNVYTYQIPSHTRHSSISYTGAVDLIARIKEEEIDIS